MALGNANNGGGPHGVHVLSASGNHIIAVANPALALSPALVDTINIKRETIDDWTELEITKKSWTLYFDWAIDLNNEELHTDCCVLRNKEFC